MPPGQHRRPDVSELELVGGVEKREIVLVPYDVAWPATFGEHEARIRAAVGDAVRVEHIGSTSVPGLAAKPIIDVLLVVPDITAEEDYLDPLLAAGYELRAREPGHRLVRTPGRDVHVHVLEVGHGDIDDYLVLRDHLRLDDADRALYERTKRALASRDWPDMNAYADAKTEVISEIMSRARLDRSAVSRLLEESRRALDRVDPRDLEAVQAAGALVVDIRPVEQRRRDGELPGAVVVGRNVLEWRLDPSSPDRLSVADDPDRRVVIVCHEGYSSSLAAWTLQQLGLPNATDLRGGFQAWLEAVGSAG